MKTAARTIDIAKNEILRDLIRDGQVHVVRLQLQTMFGELPQWADERLGNAKMPDVDRWAKKVLAASTLEDVLRKKQSSQKRTHLQ